MRSARKATAATYETALTQGLTRLEPRDGLVIDAEAWQVAHNYHVATDSSHNLAAHGTGVLAGLEVVPAGGQQLGILPGVGIDATGRLLMVPSAVRLSIEEADTRGGVAYVVVQRSEPDPDADGRVKEEAIAQILGTLPDGPYLELARVEVGANAAVGFPTDPRQPKPGEIDLRYRTIAGGHARGEISIAELSLPGAGDGHAGSGALLARAINRDGGYRARYVGLIQVGDATADATILYATGNKEFSVAEGVVGWLKGFLEGGGTVLGDGCHAAPADPFGAAFDKLAKALGRQLRRVVAGDRLLWSHHAFGAPPPGLVKTDVGLILAGGGIVYCASDYGCILAGGGETPAPRAAIRAVEELATNVAASSWERSLALSFAE